MDATRYALHGELGEAARTEAYLAAMQRRLAEVWDASDTQQARVTDVVRAFRNSREQSLPGLGAHAGGRADEIRPARLLGRFVGES
jgi:hypothetical protein